MVGQFGGFFVHTVSLMVILSIEACAFVDAPHAHLSSFTLNLIFVTIFFARILL